MVRCLRVVRVNISTLLAHLVATYTQRFGLTRCRESTERDRAQCKRELPKAARQATKLYSNQVLTFPSAPAHQEHNTALYKVAVPTHLRLLAIRRAISTIGSTSSTCTSLGKELQTESHCVISQKARAPTGKTEIAKCWRSGERLERRTKS